MWITRGFWTGVASGRLLLIRFKLDEERSAENGKSSGSRAYIQETISKSLLPIVGSYLFFPRV